MTSAKSLTVPAQRLRDKVDNVLANETIEHSVIDDAIEQWCARSWRRVTGSVSRCMTRFHVRTVPLSPVNGRQAGTARIVEITNRDYTLVGNRDYTEQRERDIAGYSSRVTALGLVTGVVSTAVNLFLTAVIGFVLAVLVAVSVDTFLHPHGDLAGYKFIVEVASRDWAILQPWLVYIATAVPVAWLANSRMFSDYHSYRGLFSFNPRRVKDVWSARVRPWLTVLWLAVRERTVMPDRARRRLPFIKDRDVTRTVIVQRLRDRRESVTALARQFRDYRSVTGPARYRLPSRPRLVRPGRYSFDVMVKADYLVRPCHQGSSGVYGNMDMRVRDSSVTRGVVRAIENLSRALGYAIVNKQITGVIFGADSNARVIGADLYRMRSDKPGVMRLAVEVDGPVLDDHQFNKLAKAVVDTLAVGMQDRDCVALAGDQSIWPVTARRQDVRRIVATRVRDVSTQGETASVLRADSRAIKRVHNAGDVLELGQRNEAFGVCLTVITND